MAIFEAKCRKPLPLAPDDNPMDVVIDNWDKVKSRMLLPGKYVVTPRFACNRFRSLLFADALGNGVLVNLPLISDFQTRISVIVADHPLAMFIDPKKGIVAAYLYGDNEESGFAEAIAARNRAMGF